MAVINVTPRMDITELINSDRVNEGDVLLLEEGVFNFSNFGIFMDNELVCNIPGNNFCFSV